jgi:hypothetical protein
MKKSTMLALNRFQISEHSGFQIPELGMFT